MTDEQMIQKAGGFTNVRGEYVFPTLEEVRRFAILTHASLIDQGVKLYEENRRLKEMIERIAP